MKNYIVARQYILRNKHLKDKGVTYKEYLRSDEWRIFKIYLQKSLNFKFCFCCGSFENIQIHHKTYKNINEEKLSRQRSNVVAFCGGCHMEVHDMTRRYKKVTLKTAVKRLRRQKSKQLKKSIPIFSPKITN